MKILGLNTYHADTSACILIDGKLIAACEEERFSRVKHFSGFPINSINFCISYIFWNSSLYSWRFFCFCFWWRLENIRCLCQVFDTFFYVQIYCLTFDKYSYCIWETKNKFHFTNDYVCLIDGEFILCVYQSVGFWTLFTVI